jgi:hypothetical protein
MAGEPDGVCSPCPHAQGVYFYARHPDDMESMTVQGRARLELIAHLPEFQAHIRRQHAKSSGRARRSTGKP